jgi:hypothetical protein
MQTEDNCNPAERFLFAYSFFSDKVIAIWQAESIKRCKDKLRGEAYELYIHWRRQQNEIAVFTLYAYADFAVPKQFDIIFEVDNPAIYVNVPYTLTQSIHEAWFPVSEVGHGHKHLCVFRFSDEVPGILTMLHKEETKFTTMPKEQKRLGFCNSKDFETITRRIEKRLSLQQEYGDQWWEYDDEV